MENKNQVKLRGAMEDFKNDYPGFPLRYTSSGIIQIDRELIESYVKNNPKESPDEIRLALRDIRKLQREIEASGGEYKTDVADKKGPKRKVSDEPRLVKLSSRA
jgi:hypothetical protein